MNNSKRVGYTTGVFDLLHIGHLKFFQKCKEYCDFLIVGVFTDEHVEFFKHRPIIPFEERIGLVEALKPVDMTVKLGVIDHIQKKKITESVDINTIRGLAKKGWNINIRFINASDLKNWKRSGKKRKCLESIGVEIIEIPYYKPRSSTGIINEINRR